MRQDKCRVNCREFGGITILVALLLLVLLTVTAVAMSKNALREAIISGTVRQGVEVRNIADNGIEWSCYWLTPTTTGATMATPDVAAKDFLAKVKTLSADKEMIGETLTLPATGIMKSTDATGVTRKFNLDVALIGKHVIPQIGGQANSGPQDISQAVSDSMLPDIWVVKSTGVMDYGVGGLAFQHIREGWITAPPQGQ